MTSRRHLLHSSLAAGVFLAAASPETRAQPPKDGPKAKGRPAKPEYYELRAYRLRIGAQPKIVNDFLGEVYIPLLNKLGVKPVGAFTLTFGPEAPTVYLLAPYPSLAAYATVQEQVAAELPKLKGAAAEAYLHAPAASPAYARLESQLLVAFESLPRLEAPERKPRVFELRTYESPGELGSAKKMEMFTPRLGELEIFRRVGLQPVFFGKTLVGPRQPSFTYMLTFPDMATRMAAWDRFRADPEWLKLKATPGYADGDIMNNVTDLVLAPTPYSQI